MAFLVFEHLLNALAFIIIHISNSKSPKSSLFSFHYLHFLFLTDAPVGLVLLFPSLPSLYHSTPLPLPALLVYLCTQILA